MPSHISGLEPNAFDNRSAMSTDMPARSFTRSESACRVMPRPFAASVTDRPSGSKHCRRTMPPGWGGLRIVISTPSSGNRHNRRQKHDLPRIEMSRANSPKPKPHGAPSNRRGAREIGSPASSCPAGTCYGPGPREYREASRHVAGRRAVLSGPHKELATLDAGSFGSPKERILSSVACQATNDAASRTSL